MFHGSRDHDNCTTHEPSSRVSDPNSRPARPSSPLKFFASSSPPKLEERRAYQKAWTANYLTDLRSNKPARPSGSRPLVQRNACSMPAPALEPTVRPSSALALSRPLGSPKKTDLDRPAGPSRCSSALSHRRADSAFPLTDNTSHASRHLVQQPPVGVASRDLSRSTPSTKAPTATVGVTYVERTQRRLEKQEARLLREALEEVDLMGEARLQAAAQDEATDLVWKHQNPETAYKQHHVSHDPQSLIEQSDHVRGKFLRYTPSTAAPKGTQNSDQRPASDGSTTSKSSGSRSQGSRSSSASSTGASRGKDGRSDAAGSKGHVLSGSPQKKAYMNLNSPVSQIKAFNNRKVSVPKSRKASGGLFSNPADKIYEEPEAVQDGGNWAPTHDDAAPAPLKLRARNSVAKLQSASYGILHSETAPEVDQKKRSRTEIHRNPPSQSRNPTYLHNTPTPISTEQHDANFDEFFPDGSRTKDGIEIRGEDIRAATSMRMKDRSPRLPSPTVISDKPGRPIVSFDRDWKPKDPQLEQKRPSTRDGVRPLPSVLRSKSNVPESINSAPAIPTINAPGPPLIQVNNLPITSINVSSVPSISVSPVPSISVDKHDTPNTSLSNTPEPTRPPPMKSRSSRPSPFRRPLPHHSSTAPVTTSAPHWSPSTHNGPTAQCAACALPIAGRIVSAASQRFHPYCFTCFHCGELLECVAFYPEPTTHRESRLARIESRASDLDAAANIDGRTALDDGDSSLRFYCHLDFHELFSPRCRSCKTPIEGEVVLACGGEWHKGHFFCAQCGDPFDEKTPFVEKDGYAWCVGCHAGRFNGKCKGCRKVILEQGVQALGGEWHEGCFCCVVRPSFIRQTIEIWLT